MKNFLKASVGAALAVGIIVWILFGTFLTFKRHGQSHGEIASNFTPYAMYRAVAWFWEEPEWKQELPRTTSLAVTLVLLDKTKDPISFQRHVLDVRRELQRIPEIEALAVRRLCENAIDAFEALTYVELAKSLGLEPDKAASRLSELEDKLRASPAAWWSWEQYRRAVNNNTSDGPSLPDKDRNDQALKARIIGHSERILSKRKEEMLATVNDAFSLR